MCDKNACREGKAAKRHVGEWCLDIDARHAAAVQFIMDEAAHEGIELASVDEVILFAILTVEKFLAARAVYTVPDSDERGVHS